MLRPEFMRMLSEKIFDAPAPQESLVPPPLSYPGAYSRRRMKTLVNGINEPNPRNCIARFGRARLSSRRDGRAELRDASPAEQTEAKEWISLFLHDSVLHIEPSN